MIIRYNFLEETPVGRICFAQRGPFLVALQFDPDETEFLEDLGLRLGSRPILDSVGTQPAADQLRNYLSGRRSAFDLQTDIRDLSGFQQRVLHAASQIPRGQTATYADIAAQLGDPKTIRAVGQALGRNPIPIVIPCHRVIAADGKLGGYSGGGGAETKRYLLLLEGAIMI